MMVGTVLGIMEDEGMDEVVGTAVGTIISDGTDEGTSLGASWACKPPSKLTKRRKKLTHFMVVLALSNR